MSVKVHALRWDKDVLFLVDQRKLPHEEVYVEINSLEECHLAIKSMVVRGAPLIGFTAIFGLALWAKENENFSSESLLKAGDYLKTARPTAVNLAYEVDRLTEELKELKPVEWFDYLVRAGHDSIEKIHRDNLKMAKFAEAYLDQSLNKSHYQILTHCNTGFLACGPLGTALGVVSYLNQQGKISHVYADETRPYLQGSRLTAYELQSESIPYSVVVEGSASYLMKKGLVDAIFVGADRVASNGDTANKIGTSNLAIIAKHYGIPFFVVAPTSSFDFKAMSGEEIDIEMRPEEEVLSFAGKRVAPLEARALNPSFDVTDHPLITGIICEKELILAPFSQKITKLAER